MGAAAGLVFYYVGMRLASDRFLHGSHIPVATINTDMEVAADGTMLSGSPTADAPTADAAITTKSSAETGSSAS